MPTALYLLAFGPLRAVFSARELNVLGDTMAERGIRMRVGLDEVVGEAGENNKGEDGSRGSEDSEEGEEGEDGEGGRGHDAPEPEEGRKPGEELVVVVCNRCGEENGRPPSGLVARRNVRSHDVRRYHVRRVVFLIQLDSRRRETQAAPCHEAKTGGGGGLDVPKGDRGVALGF